MDPDRALDHKGHRIEIASYGSPIVNVAIECVTCGTVIVDTDVEGCDECSGFRFPFERHDEHCSLHAANIVEV